MLSRMFGPLDEPRWRRIVLRIAAISWVSAIGFSVVGALVNISRGTFTVRGFVLEVALLYVIIAVGSVLFAKKVVLPRLPKGRD